MRFFFSAWLRIIAPSRAILCRIVAMSGIVDAQTGPIQPFFHSTQTRGRPRRSVVAAFSFGRTRRAALLLQGYFSCESASDVAIARRYARSCAQWWERIFIVI
jgi:hypothetical protein